MESHVPKNDGVVIDKNFNRQMKILTLKKGIGPRVPAGPGRKSNYLPIGANGLQNKYFYSDTLKIQSLHAYDSECLPTP